MIVEVQGEITVFGNGNAAFGGAAPFDRLPLDTIGEMFADQDDLKYQGAQAGRFTVTDGHDDANEVQGKDRDAAINKVWLGGPRSLKTKDKHNNYVRISVDSLTLSQPSRRIPDEDETPPLHIPARG
jgi:hypothetical protein